MPRSPLTESIQKVRRLVTEIQGTLTVDEFNLLLDELVPEPEPEVKWAKKTRKKSSTSKLSQSSSKSPRASGMAVQLKSRVSEQREAATKDITGESDDNRIVLCGASLASSGLNCNLAQGHALHTDKGYVDYHPFQSSTTAPPAPVPSPANGGVGSTTANSETQPEDVGTVAHGASGGD